MINLIFLHSLSETLAEKSVRNGINAQEKSNEFSLRGMGNAVDAVIAISKKAFLGIVQAEASKTGAIISTDKFWQEITKEWGRSWLEILTSSNMRKQHGFCYDLVFTINTIEQEECLVFNFRKSADLVTQHPKDYFPLFQGPFDSLHEVQQGEYAITSVGSKKPIVASWHFAACVGFVAFNEKHHIGILAHIDNAALNTREWGIYGCLFQDIERVLPLEDSMPLEFKYVLIGGCEERVSGHTLDPREFIKRCIELLEVPSIVFTHIGEYGEKIPIDTFKTDCSWTESTRLNRSVALDTRKNSFTEALMCYEAQLNPVSTLHAREGTEKEAEKFAKKRTTSPALMNSMPEVNEI